MTALERPKWKRWIFRLGAVAAVAFALLNALAFRQAYAMTHFAPGKPRTGMPESLNLSQRIAVLLRGVNIPRPRTGLTADALGPAAKSLQIDGAGGAKLGAWYCPGSSTNALVILFHGYTGEKSGTLAEARVFQQLGFPVLLVDFRGSGDSSESYTTIGYEEAEDVAAAVRYARQHLSPGKIVLYGQSMGAAAVLRAVHSCGARPDAIIAEAVFDTLLHTVRHRFQAMRTPSFPGAELLIFWGGVQGGFNGFRHNPVDYARSVTCPILFLHGAADPRAHVDEARAVYDAVPGPKEFKEFPGFGHGSAVKADAAEWKQTVSEFLRTYLALKTIPSGAVGAINSGRFMAP